MKILVVGAGAMGASFAHKLSKDNMVDVVDTWKENVDKINSEGLKIKEIDKELNNTKIRAYMMEDYNEKVDLVILFVKSMMLDKSLKTLQHVFSDNTKVLCLLNGLGHIKTIQKYVKKENIVMGISLVTAGLNGPADVTLSSYGYNEISGVYAKQVADVLNVSGMPTNCVSDVQESIWEKACLNGMYNSICTILDTRMSDLDNAYLLEQIQKGIIEEFHKIALKEGVDFNKEKTFEKVRVCTTKDFKGSRHYPSMHQDLRQHKRKTEIDFLNGYISKKGKEYGIPTPYCDLITFEIKVLEGKVVR